MDKIYLYLAKKDKRGIKLVMVLQGKKTSATKIEDINLLRLKANLLPQLSEIIEIHRKEWNLWIESAENYNELTKALSKRGFVNIPVKSEPLHADSDVGDPYFADTRNMNTSKTMLRRSF